MRWLLWAVFGFSIISILLTYSRGNFLGLVAVGFLILLKTRWKMLAIPITLAAALVLTAFLPDDTPWLAIATFGLAGLGCSALLPLTISLGQDALTTMSAGVAGGVIAFYQVGYGIAAFGVGPLVDHGTSLSTIYGWTAIAAAAMAVLSFAVARHHGVA